MKQTIKKFLAAAAAGACVITTSIPAFAATEGLTDDQVTQVEQIAQSYLDTIVGLSDEEAGEMKTYYQYIAPGIYGAINTWEDTKEDLGGYVGSDDVTVESDGETITCTVDAQFEKHDAEVEIIIDQVELLKGEQDALTSIAFNVDYPVSTSRCSAKWPARQAAKSRLRQRRRSRRAYRYRRQCRLRRKRM